MHFFKIVAAAALSCAVASGAHAAASVTYSSGLATGILGLDVGGTAYDVSFTPGSWDTVFASTAPAFLGNYAGANLALNSMVAALNAEPTLPLVANVDPTYQTLMVAYGDYVPVPGYMIAVNAGPQSATGPWGTYGDFAADKTVDYSDWNGLSWTHATFTASAVPEASSLALMGLGLAGIFAAARKKSS